MRSKTFTPLTLSLTTLYKWDLHVDYSNLKSVCKEVCEVTDRYEMVVKFTVILRPNL